MAHKKILEKIDNKKKAFLVRRPHRSFRITRRRDYKRSLELPGYLKFTGHVWKTIWQNRKTFLLLALAYAIITALMVGLASQDTYDTLKDTLTATGGEFFTGVWGQLGQAGLLFLTAATGGLSSTLTDVQQVYAGIILLFTWLTSIWLLRNILAGNRVKVRDGLYSAGAPVLSTFMVLLLLVVQLLPFALALIGYSAASTSGLLDNGIEAMLFWIAAGLLSMMSLYWITSTIFAMVIVTLPGMYPYQAIKTAGDLVIGRRMRILLRFLWMAFVVALTWAIIMIPTILFEGWIKSVWTAISWLPIVPAIILTLSALSIIWTSSYVYLLYRKVVADGANPA